jgi:hypothetical protein
MSLGAAKLFVRIIMTTVADRFAATLAAAGVKGLGGIDLNACASRQGSDRLSNSRASEGNSEHIYLGYE